MFFDTKPLDEIAQDMVRWCIERGCQKLSETDKEYRVQCPNTNCPSREKSGTHRAFDINKDTAKFNCFHCGLSGQGLHGERGLIATLKRGNFSPSAISRTPDDAPSFFKPKEKVEATPAMNKEELPPIAKSISKEARAYFAKRGISEHVYRDTDLRIFSAQAGAQFSFMKQPLSDTAIFFPVFNENREIVHVHYKLIHGGYYMSPGVKPIYLTKATALSIIVVVEGIFDALSVYTAGYQGAALLGHEITANHDLSVFEGKKVVVMLDNDDAGKANVNSVASVLAKVAAEVKIATVPTELGKDANDVLVKSGAAKLKEIIQNAKLYNAESTTEPTTKQETTMSNDVSEPKTGEQETESQKQATAKVADVIKPKKEIGIVFPEQAWRGIFQTYREAVQGTTEAPGQYHFGVLATIVGIIIGRACYLYHAGELYPNFYTAIVGPSGKSRKTTATNLCMRILGDVDPNVIVLRGLSSPEGLIGILQVPAEEELEDLPEHEQQRAASVMPVASYEGYRALIFCNEFASLLKKAKNEATSGIIQALTDLYDCPFTLDNPTRHRPLRAERPTGAMIALSTTEWLERNLTPEDVFGGFGNRFCFYNYTPIEPIPRPQKPDGALIERIISKLVSIRQQKRKERQIEYSFDSETEKVVDEWYIDRWYREYETDVVAVISERIDVHVRKLALLYAILENDLDDTTIYADQFKAAIQVGEYWTQSALSIFGTFGFTKTTRDEMRVIEAIDHPMTKNDIHKKLSGRLSANELEKILASLLNVGRIEKKRESYTDSMNRKRYRELYAKAER